METSGVGDEGIGSDDLPQSTVRSDRELDQMAVGERERREYMVVYSDEGEMSWLGRRLLAILTHIYHVAHIVHVRIHVAQRTLRWARHVLGRVAHLRHDLWLSWVAERWRQWHGARRL